MTQSTNWTFRTGEGLAGDGNEIAHVDVLIGTKDGPVGQAFANALALPQEKHTTLYAVPTPNLLTKPATLLVNKVSISGAKAAVQHFGPAQEAIAKAVIAEVEAGTIPKDQAEDLVVIVSVFIHWEAESNEKIAAYNHQATRLAIQNAAAGKPDIDTVLKDGKDAKHPFGSGADGWKQDEYDAALKAAAGA